jgi:hypothetical protein
LISIRSASYGETRRRKTGDLTKRIDRFTEWSWSGRDE